MDRKEAAEIIKERYEFWQKHYAEECKDYREALEIALEALQEQDHRCANCRNGDFSGVMIYCLLHSSVHRLDEYCSEWEEE